MATGLTIDAVIAAVLQADSTEAWNRTVSEVGPAFLGSLELVGQFPQRVLALRAAGRDEDADRLMRWNEAVQDTQAMGRIQSILIGAQSDRELTQLLERHRDEIQPKLVESALWESRQLLSGRGQMPPGMAELTAERILWIALAISDFLGDSRLKAQCLTLRSQIAVGRQDYEAAARDLIAAADLFRQQGEMFEVGRCLSILGDTFHERHRNHDAVHHYLEAIEILTACGDADALLAPTYESLAIAQRELEAQQH